MCKMNVVSNLIILIWYLLIKGKTCGKSLNPYDVGCYKHRNSFLDNTPESLLKILRNELPQCGTGGVWKHYQCSFNSCHCAYVDTGRTFFIENISEEQIASREQWAEACPIKSERRSNNCLKPPITYPCNVESIKYVYNISSEECVPTTGCFGFTSQRTCGSVCDPYLHQRKLLKTCNSSISQGKLCNVQLPITRYWYNFTSGKCQSFHYLGCGGNANSHYSIWNCKEACANGANEVPPVIQRPVQETTADKNRPSLVCTQPPPSGRRCRAINNKWYYDPQQSKCCRYSFCGKKPKESNIFESREECSNLCANPV